MCFIYTSISISTAFDRHIYTWLSVDSHFFIFCTIVWLQQLNSPAFNIFILGIVWWRPVRKKLVSFLVFFFQFDRLLVSPKFGSRLRTGYWGRATETVADGLQIEQQIVKFFWMTFSRAPWNISQMLVLPPVYHQCLSVNETVMSESNQTSVKLLLWTG